MDAAKPIDIAIAGGGLAGGLLALALRARRPELRVVVVEAGETAGGNHLWSCFEEDVAPEDRWLIDPLAAHGWEAHEVRFPGDRRRIEMSYASLSSERLDAALRDALPEGDLLLGRAVQEITPSRLTLDDGTVLDARAVIDARGPGDMAALSLGYQKFVGLEWRCDAPHGLDHPIIMDARVDQEDGYRFVYVLPFSTTALFIEDTYYTAGPELDVPRLEKRIAAYAGRQGWPGAPGERAETGILPVCMGGDFERYWASEAPGTGKIGLRGGFFHAMTGYSLPDAVRVALALCALPELADPERGCPDLSGAALHDRLHAMAKAHWKGQRFYRMLATLLFRAAEPAERWRILARFYRLDPALIARFYAGQSSLFDRLRILTGKPPVPIGRAIHALGAASA